MHATMKNISGRPQQFALMKTYNFYYNFVLLEILFHLLEISNLRRISMNGDRQISQIEILMNVTFVYHAYEI